MINTAVTLVNNWNNGVVMIAIFALVCLTLVGVVLKMMMSGKPKDDDSIER